MIQCFREQSIPATTTESLLAARLKVLERLDTDVREASVKVAAYNVLNAPGPCPLMPILAPVAAPLLEKRPWEEHSGSSHLAIEATVADMRPFTPLVMEWLETVA